MISMFPHTASLRFLSRPPRARRGGALLYASFLMALGSLLAAPVGAQTSDGTNPAKSGEEAVDARDAAARQSVVIAPPDDKRALAAGDKLSFQIAEEPGEKSLITVTASGEADFPYVGRLKVADRTCKEVAAELRRLLEKSFYRKATVGLSLETASTLPLGSYFVTGQVVKQGSQEIPRDREVTVSEAVLEAGGFADFADRRRVRVIRPHPGGNERFTVDVKAVLEKGEVSKDLVVHPGDYIVVPERMFNF